MKRLVLIDGNAILHRAYHALPPLTNKSGIVVNAVYGFFSMLLKILEDQKPDFIIVCFDRKAPTFRKELFVGYQAKRPKMSDDLVPQIKFVHEILEKAKVEIFEADGYEADDMIGTIAYQTQNIETIIVSGDRDLLQLVNPHVKMIAPITGLTNMFVYDQAKVIEKFGIKPSQMVDYKALVGDPSDNYPGVTGVGPKTAASLINEYGSLKNIYKNLEAIKKKNPNLALKLAEGAEAAGLAQKLATIVTDVPIKLDLQECSMAKFSLSGAQEAFEELGFKSLLKRLGNGRTEETKGTEDTQGIKDKKEKEKNQESTQMELL